MDCSLPGSPVHGIFQARILEWIAIYFSSIKILSCHTGDILPETSGGLTWKQLNLFTVPSLNTKVCWLFSSNMPIKCRDLGKRVKQKQVLQRPLHEVSLMQNSVWQAVNTCNQWWQFFWLTCGPGSIKRLDWHKGLRKNRHESVWRGRFLCRRQVPSIYGFSVLPSTYC